MVTVYASAVDVSDFLRVAPFSCSTSPTLAQVEKIINRVEERIDRRTGHTYGRTKVETEIYDVPLLYTFGHGSPLILKHREIKVDCATGLHLCACAGDKVELWQGSNGVWSDVTNNNSFYDVEDIKGTIYLRGLIFTILRTDRIRVTYRYGSDTVPDDIKDACIKLACIDLIRSSLRMDDLQFGGAIDKERAMDEWKIEADKLIRDREEVYVLP
jgi:hypothetical protein